MTDQLMGIDYFSLSTLMKDDDKVFDLKYRYAVPEGATGEAYDNDAAFAAYGRFVELLASIYREGFCLQMSKQTRLRLSQQLGLALPAFEMCIRDRPKELRGVSIVVRGPVIVGRSPGADIVVGAGYVSGRHARFSLMGQNLFVEDLGLSLIHICTRPGPSSPAR